MNQLYVIFFFYVSVVILKHEGSLHEGGILYNTQTTDEEVMLWSRLMRKIITSHSSFHLRDEDHLPGR